jgi:molybdenum cofactor cytidylyltransferase
MGSSIRVAIQALPASASAAMILLCDQPLVNITHMKKLLNDWCGSPSHIIASQYHDSVGVPAVFPRHYFEHLLALKGDRGAKSLLHQFEKNLRRVPLPEAELDIDCEKDFVRLINHNSADA